MENVESHVDGKTSADDRGAYNDIHQQTCFVGLLLRKFFTKVIVFLDCTPYPLQP